MKFYGQSSTIFFAIHSMYCLRESINWNPAKLLTCCYVIWSCDAMGLHMLCVCQFVETKIHKSVNCRVSHNAILQFLLPLTSATYRKRLCRWYPPNVCVEVFTSSTSVQTQETILKDLCYHCSTELKIITAININKSQC